MAPRGDRGAGWRLPAGHPTHTSAAELFQEAGGTVRVVIRLFADDIGATVGALAGPEAGGERLRSYLTDRFAILDRTGARSRWRGTTG